MSEAIVASIGTTHPWNIAGVGLDARVAAEYGVRHMAAVVAVSSQDETGLHALSAIPADVVRAQLRALPAEVRAYRVGALVSAENVRAVAAFLRGRPEAPVVVDPVMQATLGGALQAGEGLPEVLRAELLALPVVVTPNLAEAGMLLGGEVRDRDAMIAAGRRFVELGTRAAYVKGGHLEGDPIDVLVERQAVSTFEGMRLEGSMRGSGCTFAAALACELALGKGLQAAAYAAREYVRAKIAARTMLRTLQVAF